MADRLTAINVTRGVRLTQCGRIADNPWTKLIGLLRDRTLEFGDGMWLKPCNSIHSFGMHFAFDAIFLDKKLRVVHLVIEMKPWRISRMVFSARSVLEVPAGMIRQSATELGDQFEMQREKIKP
ncbi:MAG: DUF192 domain-containing protein [Methylacidiphilales bacterium]|nr:DUF192 domain-containing protein [Candidatus Methylacidiphilales bacterium]